MLLLWPRRPNCILNGVVSLFRACLPATTSRLATGVLHSPFRFVVSFPSPLWVAPRLARHAFPFPVCLWALGTSTALLQGDARHPASRRAASHRLYAANWIENPRNVSSIGLSVSNDPPLGDSANERQPLNCGLWGGHIKIWNSDQWEHHFEKGVHDPISCRKPLWQKIEKYDTFIRQVGQYNNNFCRRNW